MWRVNSTIFHDSAARRGTFSTGRLPWPVCSFVGPARTEELVDAGPHAYASVDGAAARDVVTRARRERAVLAREPRDQGGHLVRRPHPTEWDARDHVIDVLLR